MADKGIRGMEKGTYMENRKEDKAFDYAAAVAELEKMASRVESADVSIDDIDKYIRRSDELISGCRKYLRSAREKLSGLDAGNGDTASCPMDGD